MQPMLNIALKAARKAGDVIARAVDRLDLVKREEKSRNDFVTNIDHQAEDIIIDTIKYAYPKHAILAEEAGEISGEDFRWIIDPLDGTTNFIHGIPHFAISIAIEDKKQVQHGLIYDPLKDEVFSASLGDGAMLNNRRIRVSQTAKLDQALLATGFHARHTAYMERLLKPFSNVLKTTGDIRRAGAASLDLAYVACGRLDGYWEFGLQPWDLAAGALIVKEAGGLVSDMVENENFINTGNIIATNAKIYNQLLENFRNN